MRTVTAALAVTAVLVTAACTDDSTREGLSARASLELLPAAEPGQDIMVTMADLDALTEAVGQPRPGAGEDPLEWALAITGGVQGDPRPGYAPVPREYLRALVSEEPSELGWELSDVAGFAQVGEPTSGPRSTLLVVTGDVDLAAATDLGHGVHTVGDGSDGVLDTQASSLLRPAGAPLRLAQRDDWIAVSPSTPVIQSWLSEPDQTLAGHEDLAAVAEALDAHGAMAARLLAGPLLAGGGRATAPSQLGAAASAERIETMRQTMILEPFAAVGIGWRVVDDYAVVVVAYRFGDEASAHDSVDRVRSVFGAAVGWNGTEYSEAVDITRVTQDGQLVVATLALRPGVSPVEVDTWAEILELPFLSF